MFAAIAAAAGCGRNVGGGKADSPEVVVEAFVKAVTTGDWSAAEGLCDPDSMKEYLESHREAWETLQKEDSCIVEIATALISRTRIDVGKVEKTEDGRIVCYTLEADGCSKEKKAVVKKNEEGEWKVTEITDAI